MPKLSHVQLQEWYAKFKKAVYESSNIDMDRIEDIGRLKNFYAYDWNVDEPLGTEGELMYACIPHDEYEYDNEPPEITDHENYMNWVMDNLQVPTTDKQIQKLYDMSREGTLMSFLPGAGEAGMQQVYTDEQGNVKVSLPMIVMEMTDSDKLDPEYCIPDTLTHQVKEPDPKDYGLDEAPIRPEKPENLKPGFWSWIGYLLGLNTDYKKLKDYRDFDNRFKKWYDSLDENDASQDRRVADYKAAKAARDTYVANVKAYWANPIGKTAAMCKGLGGMRTDFLMQDDKAAEKLFAALDAEVKFMKKQHSVTPQGRILTFQENIDEKIQGINRTKNIIRNLVGPEPKPEDLEEWVQRRIFDPAKYQPEAYEVPQHPNYDNVSADERADYTKKMKGLAEIAGFAALSHSSVSGKPQFEGFDAEQTSQLQYSMILFNIFTSGRENCDYYMQFMDPARTKAKAALEAYHGGQLGPMAELLANSIRKTNREVANLSSLTSAHSTNTLYLVSRMWNVLQEDDKLREATGLTPEEIEETKANVALYQVTKKCLDSKKALFEYALHQRKMTPEQVKEAGADVLLAYQLEDSIRSEHDAHSQSNFENPDYLAATAKAATAPDVAEKEMNLIELKRPGYVVIKDLLKNNWIEDAKAALVKECNLNKLNEMTHEDLGSLLSSQTSFRNAFKPVIHQHKANTLANENVMQRQVSQQQPEQSIR